MVTATKSHAGKGTITDFFRGNVPQAVILYQNLDWPIQSQVQRHISQNPDIGIVCFDNARVDTAGGHGRFIRSACIESFVTSPEIKLASPGAGESIHRTNSFIFTINSNDGSFSPDLLNRALLIHLAPKGNVQDRQPSIGNPKYEFLPQNQERIEAELRGMIDRWKKQGSPLDETVKHPMTPWARTVGGILKANGFSDFLANYATHSIVDDPVREALAILAGAAPGKELKPCEWAKIAVEQGVSRTLFSANDRDTAKSRGTRGIGVVLKKHIDETFETTRTTAKGTLRIRVRLEGGYRRWQKSKPHTRYVFTVLKEEPLAEDKEPGTATTVALSK